MNFAEEGTPGLRVLKTSKTPMQYLIYNMCLYKFTSILAKSFKIRNQKKSFLVKLSQQIWASLYIAKNITYEI